MTRVKIFDCQLYISDRSGCKALYSFIFLFVHVYDADSLLYKSLKCHLRLIHMYPATESGRSESGPFIIGNYFLWLFSLEEHQWRIIPHRNASTP